MDQLQKDFADIEEMIAQNRRANVERARREWAEQQHAEVEMELRRRASVAESSMRYWRGNFLVLAIAVAGVTMSYVVAYLGAR